MLQLHLQPFPELKTERLLLRRITVSDAKNFFFLRSYETVMRFIDKEPAKSIEEVEAFIKRIDDDINDNKLIQWAIALREEPTLMIGAISYWRFRFEDYRAETGYTLHPQYWKKGIMKEALLKVIDYGFTRMGLHSIEANINPGNTASARLLESTGFVKEAYFKEDYFYRGKFLDTVIYSRLADPIS